jgi:hypothetical protein
VIAQYFRIESKEQSYHLINGIFVFIIVSVIVYSALFSGASHPIPALLTKVTGIVPPSKGLSQSFSEIVRGNIQNALLINPYSIRVFSFFAIQLALRVFFSILVRISSQKIQLIAITDTIISTAFFLWSFAPLILYTAKLFQSVVV